MISLMKFFLFFFILTAGNVWATKDVHEGVLRVQAGEKELRFSGYFDGYYAYDFSNPENGGEDLETTGGTGGRQYTSNPLYDRQFSVGYGFLQVEFVHQNVGFRLAYHFGDIVQKMYLAEPERLKDIREASASLKLTDKLMVEVGYMPSIFGFETFINKENMHATRSYMTDFAPDFDAGVRFYWTKSDHEVLKFQVTNGWQVERDNNKSQALGFAYVYEVPKSFLFNWGQFFGDESPNGVKTSYRYYNNIFAKIQLDDKWILAPMLDVGWQQELTSSKKPWSPWQSYGVSLRYALTPKIGWAARYDRTYDPHTIIPELETDPPTDHGWSHNGYTLTYEYLYNKATTFRIEGRYVKSRDAIFKTNHEGEFSDEDSFLQTSLALSF
jgi:Putative beta-barrel porin-2, OmpL-like. bbp2